MEQGEYRCFIDPLPDAPNHWLLYLFEVNPNTGRCADLADDGMPDGKWAWLCNLQVIGQDAILRGARSAPPDGGLVPLVEKGLEMGCKWVEWKRCDQGKLIPKRFPLTRRLKTTATNSPFPSSSKS